MDELLSSLHGKKREQRRAFISCIAAKRQQQYKDGKLRQYIRSVLQLAGSGGLPKVILTRDPVTRVPILLTEPDDIRKSERDVMDEWLGRNRDRDFIRDKIASKVDHPTFADNPTARLRRVKIQYATEPIVLADYDIPDAFRDVVIASKVKKSGKFNVKMTPAMYGDIRSRCITYEEWDEYIAMKSKQVAPGASGVQYVHLAAMPVDVRHDMCDIANLAIQSGHIFTMWKRELIYRIPKEPGNPDQLKQRPLKLQEVMRKITLGIKKNHLLKVWHEHKLISPQQFAFMKGWSTSEPIIIKKLTLELSRLTKQCVLALDEDLKRAYDQTERFVKEMSLRRFGVPEDMIEWIMDFDRGNRNVVLTAYGDSDPFEAEMGAWAQGDDFSPIGWVVTMDWLVSVVRLASTCPVRVGNAIIDAILYADDASYLQRALNSIRGVLRGPGDIPGAIDAIQQVANATERYCGFTGHQIRVDKSALQMLLYVRTASGAMLVPKEQLPTLYLRRWQSATTAETWGVKLGPLTAFPLVGPYEELRHLGHTESAMGTAPVAKKLALASTRQAARMMNMKRLQPSGAKYIAEAVLRARAQYKLIYLNATVSEIDEHQASVSRTLCKAAHAPYNLPNALKYGARGGMHWDKWSDVVNIERLLIVMKGINSPGATGQLLLASIDQLQRMIGASVPVMEVPVGHLVTTGIQTYNTWLFNIWKWMTHPNRAVNVVGLPAGYTPKRENDANIVEFVSCNANRVGKQTKADMVATIQRGCYALDVHLLSDLYMKDGVNLKEFMLPGGIAFREHPDWHSAVYDVISIRPPLGGWIVPTPPIRLGEAVCRAARSGERHVGIVDSFVHPRDAGKVCVAWMDMPSARRCEKIWTDGGGDANVYRRLKTNYSCATLWSETGQKEVVDLCDLTALDSVHGSNYQTVSVMLISDDAFIRKCSMVSRQVAPAAIAPEPVMSDIHLAGYFDSDDYGRYPNLVLKAQSDDLTDMLSSGDYMLVGCSDGSVQDDHLVGTYGWSIALYKSSELTEAACNPKDKLFVVAAGSGKCAAADNTAIGPLDSTRMESIGIVAGLEAWKEICDTEASGWHEINWVCDNDAACDTYRSHRFLNMRQWQSLCNKDVWGHLDTWCTSDMRASINVKWHRGHPEKRKDAVTYSTNDWLNVWADAFAEDAYMRCESTVKPWLLPNKVKYYVAHDKLPDTNSGMIVGSVRKTLLTYFQRQNGMAHAANHTNIIPDIHRADLLRFDLFERKLKSPALHAQQCKRVWELNFTKSAAHAADSNVSPLCCCGKANETVRHMYYSCTAPHMVLTRQEHDLRYLTTLDEQFYEPKHKKWKCFWEDMFMLNENGTVRHWDQMPCSDPIAAPDADGYIDLTQPGDARPAHVAYPQWYVRWLERSDVDQNDYRATRNQIRLGSRMLWKGLWAPGLQKLLHRMTNLGINSEAFLAEVNMQLLDMHRGVWKMRCSYHNGRGVSQQSLKQQEILQKSLQIRLELAPYTEVATAEHLVLMDTKQLKRWLNRATSLLRRHTPTELGLRSFFAPAASVKKGSMLYTNRECRGDTEMKSTAHRPVADLVGSMQVMVRERPMFVVDTNKTADKLKRKMVLRVCRPITFSAVPAPSQHKNSLNLKAAVPAPLTSKSSDAFKANLVASVREGCVASEAAWFKVNRGVSIDEYEVRMPYGLKSGCFARPVGRNTIKIMKGKHNCGIKLRKHDDTETGISTGTATRQWHRKANNLTVSRNSTRCRCEKRQRNVAVMLGRSDTDEVASLRARKARERMHSVTAAHSKRKAALANDDTANSAMRSELQHIKKKVRPTKPGPKHKRRTKVKSRSARPSTHTRRKVTPKANVTPADEGAETGPPHPERTASHAASGKVGQFAPHLRQTKRQDSQPLKLIRRSAHTDSPAIHLRAHDTCPRTGEPVGQVASVPQTVTHFIDSTLQGRVVFAHDDGHCLRRSIGKIYGMQPGSVIQLMRERCGMMIGEKMRLYIESETHWYETVRDRPPEWDDIKNNEVRYCPPEEWGGQNERQLWSEISTDALVIIDVDHSTVTVHVPWQTLPWHAPKIQPSTPSIITLSMLENLHMSYINSGNRAPQYLLYGQNHYNSVVYGEDTTLIGAVAELHHPERTAGTAASGDLDTAPSLDAFLSNQQQDNDRNNRGSKRKTDSPAGAATEPSHPERTAGTAASGDPVSAPRLSAFWPDQQHHSERRNGGIKRKTDSADLTTTGAAVTATSAHQAGAAGVGSRHSERTTGTVASGGRDSGVGAPDINTAHKRQCNSRCGAKSPIDLTKPRECHISKGRGSVDCDDMQLQLLQSGLPVSPGELCVLECGVCRAVCDCTLDT